ncbi:MAG: dTDP-4-dehydrorhamnose reductase [Bacteroidota bacterium]
MRVLVTGASGQVGRAILRLAPALGVDAVGLARADLDITDAVAVRQSVGSVQPDAVVNAAAYTAVDRAESAPDLAFAVNRDGARNVAEAARQRGVPVVQISTDYVFDGTQPTPYKTDDPTAPLGVYGASKEAGERAVRDTTPDHMILRTAWVFSEHDGNFVTTMLRLASERDRLRVVADQWGHPTAADDVARAALAAATKALDGLSGTVHAAGAPLATWHDLAVATVEEAARVAGKAPIPVDPISTAEYPTPARRPARVELDMASSLARFGLAPFDWRTSLAEVVRRRIG